MPTLAFRFKSGKLPEGFRGNLQKFADKLAEVFTGYVDGNFLTGQIGGAKPSEDVGIWVHDGTLELWNEDASDYKPFTSVPPGAVIAFAGAGTAPLDYLLCDGKEYQRAEYPTLFAAIGTTYGFSSQLTFKVPDLRARYVVGAGAGVAYQDASAAQGATIIGALRERLVGYFYGQEFIRNETRPTNPVTVIKNQRVGPTTSSKNMFSSVIPPSVGLQYIIRAR